MTTMTAVPALKNAWTLAFTATADSKIRIFNVSNSLPLLVRAGATVAVDDAASSPSQRCETLCDIELDLSGGDKIFIRPIGSDDGACLVVLLDSLKAQTTSMISVPAKSAITRPADVTAYAAGDLIANSTTVGSVTPFSWTGATLTGSGGSGIITDLIVDVGGSNVLLGRAHFFRAAPTVTNGDNGALLITSWDADAYIGYIDFATDMSLNGGQAAYASSSVTYSLPSGDTIFGLLEARGTWTPPNAGAIRIKPKFRRLA